MVHFVLPSARHWLFVVAILALSGVMPAAAGQQALGAPYMVRAWGTREYLGYPLELTAIGDTLFFSAADSRGSELWKSDGTSSGSVIVKDIQPGIQDSSPQDLVNVNGVPIATVDHTITVQATTPPDQPSSTQRKIFLPVLVK